MTAAELPDPPQPTHKTSPWINDMPKHTQAPQRETSERSMSELKPCPFCGSAPQVEPHETQEGSFTEARIWCDSIDCIGPHTTAGYLDDAVKQWNTRATPPQCDALSRDALVKKISAAMADGKDSGGYDTLLDMYAHIALKVIDCGVVVQEVSKVGEIGWKPGPCEQKLLDDRQWSPSKARAARKLDESSVQEVQQPKGEADDLEGLVARFSKRLLAKLKLARANGRSGWGRDDWEEQCQQGLLRHLAKGDPRDVAAYCAFMDHHGWITKAPPAPTAEREAPIEELARYLYEFVEDAGSPYVNKTQHDAYKDEARHILEKYSVRALPRTSTVTAQFPTDKEPWDDGAGRGTPRNIPSTGTDEVGK